jgi:type II secretion system protein H
MSGERDRKLRAASASCAQRAVGERRPAGSRAKSISRKLRAASRRRAKSISRKLRAASRRRAKSISRKLRAASRRRAKSIRLGFTLIEILAVVAILALVAAFVVPNFSGMRARALRSEAQQLAGQLELARQRAIVTGVPHRLWLELDDAEYRLEWLAEDPAAQTVAANQEFDLRGNAPLSLVAPRAQGLEYRPIPGTFGRLQVLTEPFYVETVETPGGVIDSGEVAVAFARDGSADYTQIVLEDGSGNRVVIDVAPLDERVRIRHDL